MSLADRVKEIINIYRSSSDISAEEATSAILQAFREVMPNKIVSAEHNHNFWNAYHDAVMERII